MITNHQNHNQITNPNPQPHHHSPLTSGKRKSKTTLQNHNQITNPQPHHHQNRKRKKKNNHRERPKAHQLDDPRRSKTHVELFADDPRHSILNADAHAGQRPVNPDPQIQSPHRQALPPYRRQHSEGEEDLFSSGI